MTRRGLAIFLALQFFLASFPALGAQKPREVVVAQPYLESCEGLLQAMETEDVETYFASQADSLPKALQLLTDYGLIFTDEFRLAVVMALESRGLTFPGVELTDIPNFPDPVEKFAARLKRASHWRPEKFRRFGDDVLRHFPRVVTAQAPNNGEGVVRGMLAQRFVQLLKTSDNPQLRNAFELFLRASLLATARAVIVRRGRIQNPWGFGATSILAIQRILKGTMNGLIFGITAGFPAEMIVNQYLRRLQPNENETFAIFAVSVAAFTAMQVKRLTMHLGGRRRWAYDQAHRIRNETPAIAVPFADLPSFRAVNSLVQPSHFTMKDVTVSLFDTCSDKSLCAWTPVQLAYLGQMELAESKTLAETLQQQIQMQSKVTDRLLGIRELAQQTRNNPWLRPNLDRQVTELVDGFVSVQTSIVTGLARLERQIQDAKLAIAHLRQQVEAAGAKPLSPNEKLQNELLLARLTIDTEIWKDAKVNSAQVLEDLEALKSKIQTLKTCIDQPTPELKDIRDQAATLLLLLDQI